MMNMKEWWISIKQNHLDNAYDNWRFYKEQVQHYSKKMKDMDDLIKKLQEQLEELKRK